MAIKGFWEHYCMVERDIMGFEKLVPQVEPVEKDIMDKYKIIIKQLRQRLNELRGNQ